MAWFSAVRAQRLEFKAYALLFCVMHLPKGTCKAVVWKPLPPLRIYYITACALWVIHSPRRGDAGYFNQIELCLNVCPIGSKYPMFRLRVLRLGFVRFLFVRVLGSTHIGFRKFLQGAPGDLWSLFTVSPNGH